MVMSLEQSIFSLRESLARVIHSLVNGRVQPMRGTSGLRRDGSSAQLDHDGLWLKTWSDYSQLTMDNSLPPFSLTWTRWGIVLDGWYTGLVRSAPRISVNESSWWPTYLASEAEHGGPNQRASSGKPTLTAMARATWSTPTAIDSGSGRVNKSDSPAASVRPTLAMMARKDLWPTPAAQDGKNAMLPPSQQDRDTLPGARLRQAARWPTPNTGDANGGASTQTNQVQLCYVAAPQPGQNLNPAWVETLMGFPIGWTDVGPQVLTPRRRHGSRRARLQGGHSPIEQTG